MIRKISDDPVGFTLPYWDWIGDDDCEVCTNDLVGANSPNASTVAAPLDPASPFSTWNTSCSLIEEAELGTCGLCDPEVNQGPLRRLAGRAGERTYPTPEDMERILNRPLYDAFNASNPRVFTLAMEGQHNMVR